MIPFDLVRFDGSSSENGKGIIDSILSIAKVFLYHVSHIYLQFCLIK